MVLPVFFLPRLLILVLISEIVDLNFNCGQPWEDGSKSQMVTKSLLVRYGSCVMIPVGRFIHEFYWNAERNQIYSTLV